MLSIIQVGHNDASDRYIRNKVKAIEQAGLSAEVINIPEDSAEVDVVEAIWCAHAKPDCKAVMLQLPLPAHMYADRLLTYIPEEADIDGLNPHSDYVPLTPSAIMRWLTEQGVSLEGKVVAILGRSNLVGKPLANLMIEAGATVTVMNSKTDEEFRRDACRMADIIVSAVGKCNAVSGDYINVWKPQIVIDVGINRNDEGKLCGDVSQKAKELVESTGGVCTPVPGGVGKWTVRELVLRLKEFED